VLPKDKTKFHYYADYGYPSINDSLTEAKRPEYAIMEKWIQPGSTILDLGCGDGTQGKLLIKKGCVVYGLDVSPNGVEQARAKGVQAEVADIDLGLNYHDKSFDYALLTAVIFMVYRPDFVLQEALRVGRRVIVSFPNFAFLIHRLELLFGHYPRLFLHGYSWYNTRQIRSFSYRDFVDYLKEREVQVLRKAFLRWDYTESRWLCTFFPNLFARVCILMLEKP